MGKAGPTTSGVCAARGFTLVELLVALTVSAVLLVAAVPAYRSIVLDNARAAAVNDLVAALTLARSEAQKQRRQIVVCPLADGNCRPAVRNWNGGWLVYADRGEVSPPVFEAGDPVLAVFGRRGADVLVRGNVGAFVFRPAPLRNVNGTVTFCDRRGSAQARAVIVAPSGRVRVTSQVAACA